MVHVLAARNHPFLYRFSDDSVFENTLHFF